MIPRFSGSLNPFPMSAWPKNPKGWGKIGVGGENSEKYVSHFLWLTNGYLGVFEVAELVPDPSWSKEITGRVVNKGGLGVKIAKK